MDKVEKTEEQWKKELSPELYRILREKGTEPPFSGKYVHEHADGTYRCAGCGEALFTSDTKYDSGSGWPSFYTPVAPDVIEEHEDRSFGMRRIEITCARCGAHLGHVFPDGPQPTGMRYCVNSASLDLEKK